MTLCATCGCGASGHPKPLRPWQNRSAPEKRANASRGLTIRPEKAGTKWLTPSLRRRSTWARSQRGEYPTHSPSAWWTASTSTASAGAGREARESVAATCKFGTAKDPSGSSTDLCTCSREGLFQKALRSTTCAASPTAADRITLRRSRLSKTSVAATRLVSSVTPRGTVKSTSGATAHSGPRHCWPARRATQFAHWDCNRRKNVTTEEHTA